MYARRFLTAMEIFFLVCDYQTDSEDPLLSPLFRAQPSNFFYLFASTFSTTFFWICQAIVLKVYAPKFHRPLKIPFFPAITPVLRGLMLQNWNHC